MIETLVFIFGMMVGSFLNVCIYRLPRNLSIVRPGSRCPRCEKPIAWYDNIPILSYLFLQGRCRYCKAEISVRYLLIEFLSGFLWLTLWTVYGFSLFFVTGILLMSILLAVSVTDFETGFIPDTLTLPGLALGLVLSAVLPQLHREMIWYRGLLDAAAGVAAGGLILWSIGMVGNLIYRKETMGGGDVKLLAMIGAYLGLKEVVLVFLLAPIVAMPFALYMKLVQKKETIPFGPFLAITGGYFFIYGDNIAHFFFP